MKKRLARFAAFAALSGFWIGGTTVIVYSSGEWWVLVYCVVPIAFFVHECRGAWEYMEDHSRYLIDQAVRLCNGPSEYARIADLAAKEGWDYARFEKALNDAGLFDDRIRTAGHPTDTVAP